MITSQTGQFSPSGQLGLYIHIPWCVRKCPYCDFNSHQSPDILPEADYVQALINDFKREYSGNISSPIQSIFIGGGTPSLFSASAIERLLSGIAAHASFADKIEITLEANPGTVDKAHFRGYRQAGVNRLSLGIQSFDNQALQALGRIHDNKAALSAVDMARAAGFEQLNLDMMYALPEQNLEQALDDLAQAIALAPEHLSWYQLTIEPNTWFFKHPPPCPDEDVAWDMQTEGQAALAQAGFSQYEISAYAKPDSRCQHNLNYWLFGDYIGIGAGAHGKYTDAEGQVWRYQKPRQPKTYLQQSQINRQALDAKDLKLEFMLNALRLREGFACAYYKARTGLDLDSLEPGLTEAKARAWLEQTQEGIHISATGQQFLNDLLLLFYED